MKIPKTITHTNGLIGVTEELDTFLVQVAGLGQRLGCLLVQLPPSLALDRRSANNFFGVLRRRYAGDIAAEPRHPTWFSAAGDAVFSRHRVARVAPDPARVPSATRPGGWPELVYYRLHGSPRLYYSSYDPTYLRALAGHLMRARHQAKRVWCIFDNTASGAAIANALELDDMLQHGARTRAQPVQNVGA